MAGIDLALIDIEYPGHETTIRRQLLNLLRRNGLDVHQDRIAFGYIGKESRAHAIALATFRGVRQADRVLAATELLTLF